ncbi:hypothetical protein V8F33_004308 [Rhypophila sp. PSN 637]
MYHLLFSLGLKVQLFGCPVLALSLIHIRAESTSYFLPSCTRQPKALLIPLLKVAFPRQMQTWDCNLNKTKIKLCCCCPRLRCPLARCLVAAWLVTTHHHTPCWEATSTTLLPAHQHHS